MLRLRHEPLLLGSSVAVHVLGHGCMIAEL
jgi:hypothetical protein